MEYPPCKKCGADHGMGIEEMATGKITPIDVCRKCLFTPPDYSLLVQLFTEEPEKNDG